MPVQLLPASAAAFAPRASSVNVVLGNKAEPWLTQTLKRINRVKRPLNNVSQHHRCLTETLSSPNAIWTLASVMLPKVPESDMPEDPMSMMLDPSLNSPDFYQMVHIEAYIVHVDMVSRHEVAYKLTTDTIDALVEYHLKVHCEDAKANTYDWSEKEQQCKKLHEDFIQAINKFVYRTNATALEGLEEEGAGELLCGKSEEVKNNLFGLMKPLVAPPPRVVETVRPQPPLLPSSPVYSWWSQPMSHTPPNALPAFDPWGVLPSSPSVASSSAESVTTPVWANMGMSEAHIQSPTLAYSAPQSTACMFYSSAPIAAPIPALPLPSTLSLGHCGINMGMGMGFGWDRMPDFPTIM